MTSFVALSVWMRPSIGRVRARSVTISWSVESGRRNFSANARVVRRSLRSAVSKRPNALSGGRAGAGSTPGRSGAGKHAAAATATSSGTKPGTTR